MKALRKNVLKFILTSQFLWIVGFLYSQKQELVQEADALNDQGWKHIERKDDSCMTALQKAMDFSQRIGYGHGIADAHNNFGVYYKSQDDYEKAQHHFFKALEFYDDERNLPNMAACYNNIGNIFYHLQDPEKALFYYSRALDIHLRLKQYIQYSQTCNNIGAIFNEKKDNKSAIKYYDKGLKYADSVKNPRDYAHLLLNKGNSLFALNDLKNAKYFHQKALNFYEKHNMDSGLCAAYFDIGYTYELSGSMREALYYYHQSLALARKNNYTSLMDKPLEGLMLVHNQLQNQDSVEYYYYELADINGILFKQKTDKNIHDVETKYQTEKKEQALILEKERREKSEQVNKANSRTISFLSVAVALALMLILGVWIYQNQKQMIIQLKLQQKNDEIERMISEQQVKAYESQLEGEAQERRRIASELHDRVGGLMATLNLHFEVLTEKKELNEEGEHIQQLIKAAIDEVRTISHNLHGIGQSKGLYNSLEQLKDAISSSGRIEMSLFYEVGDVILPEIVNAELYKIVQELSTNTLKHAKAKKITVQLSVIENVLHLIYEDDGIGFDAETATMGLGISNVAERVDRCNGTWHIDSRVGRGTTVIINIPFE